MKRAKFILNLLLFIFSFSEIFAQEKIIIDPIVGEIIDSKEKEKYKLFESIPIAEFKSAYFYKDLDSILFVKIIMTGNTVFETVYNVNQFENDKLKIANYTNKGNTHLDAKEARQDFVSYWEYKTIEYFYLRGGIATDESWHIDFSTHLDMRELIRLEYGYCSTKSYDAFILPFSQYYQDNMKIHNIDLVLGYNLLRKSNYHIIPNAGIQYFSINEAKASIFPGAYDYEIRYHFLGFIISTDFHIMANKFMGLGLSAFYRINKYEKTAGLSASFLIGKLK